MYLRDKMIKDYVHSGPKMVHSALVYLFIFWSLIHADNKLKTKTCDGNQVWKKIRGRKSVQPVHFNVMISIAKMGKIVKKKNK